MSYTALPSNPVATALQARDVLTALLISPVVQNSPLQQPWPHAAAALLWVTAVCSRPASVQCSSPVQQPCAAALSLCSATALCSAAALQQP